jgi:hypothetical protein
MRGLSGEILRMDFNYKIAAKVLVYKGRGQSFVPFKCILTVQNECAMTMYWKALQSSESMKEIIGDLCRLRDRNRLNGKPVKVIRVDNCCSTGKCLRRIFGDEVLVKLDVFHWLKRWDKMLAEPGSGEAVIFRVLMSRAVFCVEPETYRAAKAANQSTDTPPCEFYDSSTLFAPPECPGGSPACVLS